jgi:uncharacterized glyoxalase superfamily protein PhnB
VPGWGVIPTIRVEDMADALAFYLGPLEFTLERGGEGEGNSALVRGDARLMLETPSDFYALYLEEPDLNAFYERIQAAGVRVVDPLAERPWGQSEFTVEDPAGNWLTFWAATAPAG